MRNTCQSLDLCCAEALHLMTNEGEIWQRLFGHIDKFQPANYPFTAYLVCIDLFFTTNDMDAERQVPIFLRVNRRKDLRPTLQSSSPSKAGKDSILWSGRDVTEAF